MYALQPGPVTPPPTLPAQAPASPADARARRLATCADSTLFLITVVQRAAQIVAETPPPPSPDPLALAATAEALATLIKVHVLLSRSLRQTTALEAKLEAFAAAGPTAFAEAEAQRTQLRKTLIRKVEDAITDNARPDARENLLHEFYERLEDSDLGTELETDLARDGIQPIAVQTCRDLGIVVSTTSYPRRTPEALAQLLARALARPTATGPP